MTFSDILSAVYDECQYASSPAAAVATRMKRFVNEGVRIILGEPGLLRLADSDQPVTFATTASTARYVLPEAVARIHHITERTNDQALIPMSLAAYRRLDPDATASTGTPTHYVPIGRVAVATQPSDASAIFTKSDSGSDGAGTTTYLEGITSGGIVRTSSSTMNGTTAVQTSSTNQNLIEITDWYLSANAVGTVTLHEDSGSGTELARITPGFKRPRYYGIYLWPTPAAAVTYYTDYRREITDLVNDTDEPPLVTDAHPILVAYAVMRETEKTGKADQREMARARYQRMLDHLKYQTQTMTDEIPVMGRGRLIGRSRLGAMYPADIFIRG